MKRLHVHLSVENLSDSIRFYSTLFAATPSVTKSDYAKWMLDDPRVNFAISERGSAPGINHLGVQVESSSELSEMQHRIERLQVKFTEQTDAACCYAKSDKYWVNDPQGIAWESFHTLDSIPVYGETDVPNADGAPSASPEATSCCVPLAQSATASACCVPTSESKTTRCC